MVRFWERCGYIVKGTVTKRQCCFSIIDIVLSVMYAVLSLVNLASAQPSLLLLFVNLIILARFTLASIIQLQKITDSKIDKNKTAVNIVYIVKITIGMLLSILFISVSFWARIVYGDFGIIKFIAFFVVIVSLAENIWNIGEKLYNVVPQPLFYQGVQIERYKE